jgi:hypothetical protein
VLAILSPERAAERAHLHLQVPRHARRGHEAFFDLEGIEIRNRRVKLAFEVRIDDGRGRDLDLLNGWTHARRLTGRAKDRIEAVTE